MWFLRHSANIWFFFLHCRLIACIAFLHWLVTFCLCCSSCSLGLWGTHGCSVCSQKSLAQRTKYTLSTGFATILALGPSMDGKDRFSIADRTIWLFPTRANSWTPQNLVFSERERRSSFPPPISDLDRQLQTSCRLACCYSFLMIFPPAPLPVFLGGGSKSDEPCSQPTSLQEATPERCC